MGQYSNSKVIWKVLDEQATKQPGSIFFYIGDNQITYGQVNEITDHVACGLLNMGIKRGDRIAVNGLNTPDWLFAYFGAAKIGACIVGLNVRYRDSELEYILNQSQTETVITLPGLPDFNYVDFFQGFKPKIPTVKNFMFFGSDGFDGALNFNTLVQAPIDTEALARAKASVQPDDLIMIIYTSGTTGQPKGAAITNASQLASALGEAEHCQIRTDDVFLGALPFNHVGGITCCLLTSLLAGAAVLLIPAPDLEMIIKQSARYGLTVVGGVPTLHTLLLMTPAIKDWDKSKVRLVITGGSNAEPELLTNLTKNYPNATVMNLYGLSESSGAVVLSPWDSGFERLLKSIGTPVGDAVVKIMNEDGQELPTGETGELYFNAGAVCGSYFLMPDASNEAFLEGGWLKTGDMGYVDENGYIYLMGRKKEMYLQGGFNVYPVEVENLLTKHPKVSMAAGIGVPDPVLGEIGRYYIVPMPGEDPTEDEIKAFCGKHLADYKVPRQIIFREALPMTPVGKIMKSTLKAEYEAER